MLKVVDELSTKRGVGEMRVVIMADTANFQEAFGAFDGMDAQNMALSYAGEKGIRAPAINSVRSQPFPVNKNFENIAELINTGVPETDERAQPYRYVVAIQVVDRI